MSHFIQSFRDKNETLGISGTPLNAANFGRISPMQNVAEKQFIRANNMTTRGLLIAKDTFLKRIIEEKHLIFDTSVGEVRIDDARDLLDSGATFVSGANYYIYLVHGDADEFAANLVVSLNSTFPVGFTEANSRKIGGFHTLCKSVGTISGHKLSGYQAGDIIPNSVWCLTHRPWPASPEGMVYCDKTDAWYDIYLQSGTGVNTKSAYGATITDTRTYMDHVDDFAAVGKMFLSDEEFQIVMDGSNQQTNIIGSADPVTTGGHNDTANRRMISHYGLEDGCGAMWQWLNSGGWMSDGTAWSTDWPGGKGQVYGSGKDGLLAGGNWTHAAYCGSRCRVTFSARSVTYTSVGGRGRARNI